jgi:hypothetical protein
VGVKLIYNKRKISLTLVITSFFILTTIIPTPLTAEDKKTIDFSSDNIITITFDKDDFEFDKYNGYDVIRYPDGGQTTDIGKPMLPSKNILVALPNEMIAKNVKILEIKQIEFPSKFNILPTQAPQKVGTRINTQTYSYYFDFLRYTRTYPSKKIELIGMADFAGQGMALFTIYPFQYDPYLKTLKLIKSIKFEIVGEMGYACGDYLPNYISELEIDLYKEKVRNMVYNPEDVILQTKNVLRPLAIDSGDYDYVIITKNDWLSAFQTLADWKTQKGIPANIVTTEDIYANYSGSTNQEKIRAFIIDAHSNWGTTLFLLGGDTDTIPYKTVNYKNDNIPTDTYYSDYDDDWICEVNVGRASVTGTGTGTGEIGNFISKTLNYEKNPPTTSFAKNISLFGFDLDSITDGEDCKIDIDSLYIPANWTVTKIYDSHDGNHEDNVDIAVNSGQNLINHIDHSGQYYMGTGYTNHDWGLDNSEVDDFSNGNKQGTWYSIGCWAAAIDYDNCIAEHFVRDTDVGGVGFVGNTRYGWYWVGGDDLASLRYDRYFFRSFFIQNHYKLGDLFSDHKIDAYFSMTQDDLNKYIFSELILLGDPELPIWMENPSSFDVTHPAEVTIGSSSSFTVHVEDSIGGNVENAYVCLWKGDEVYLTNYTDSSGNIIFNISPETEGNMSVTVTKKDYIPYEDNVDVVSNQPPNTPSDPNPPDGATEVSVNTGLSWNCSDPDGDPLIYDVYFGSSYPPGQISSNQTANFFDPGTLEYSTTYYWMIVAWDDSGASAQGPDWSFTTGTNNPPYKPINPIPANGSTNVDIDIDIKWDGGDPDGDIVAYDVYFGTTNPPPQVVYNVTEYSPGILELNTTYYWKIVAWDEHGASSKGDIWMFKTIISLPPEPPILDGPSSGKAGVEYCLTVYSTGSNEDEFMYLIDWGDETTSGWIGPYPQGVPQEVCHTYYSTGNYNIRAKAKDSYGTESEWSDTFSVNIPRNRASIFKLNLISWILERFQIINRLLYLII